MFAWCAKGGQRQMPPSSFAMGCDDHAEAFRRLVLW
jgi:hypothetical protein